MSVAPEQSQRPDQRRRRIGLLAALGPGMLVAATGVGAGDIAAAGFAGSHIGYIILWAALLGAFIKFVVNEGLARWQLATGSTMLEGAVFRLGRPVIWIFVVYLFIWSFTVGASLISACGVAAHALLPGLFADAKTGTTVLGILHSIAAVVLIFVGGYKRFEQLMTLLLIMMFVTVIATAIMMNPDWSQVARGLLIPRLPQNRNSMEWTLALMGGVGGTLTVLCYGYWIREQGRQGPEDLRLCRVDLGVAYGFTALFGMSIVIICTGLTLGEAGGARFMTMLADQLGGVLGPTARLIFLIGAWGAVFTSLLGVWQAVPYLFCDFWAIVRRSRSGAAQSPTVASAVNRRSLPYRAYLIGIATIPMIGLFATFQTIQKVNAMFGALVMPMLALALLIMNSRSDWVGRAYRNRPLTILVLVAVLLFFAAAGVLTLMTGKQYVS